MNKCVSIIMGVYNEKEEWLKLTIESIINQTYKNFEYIIVLDNPKAINLRNILEEYQNRDNRIKLIFNKENIGLVKSLNKALNVCSGEYIARIDADDIADKERIEKQVNFLKTNMNIDFISSLMYRIDEQGNILSKDTCENYTIDRIKEAQWIGYYFPHPTWMFKREILDKLKGYNNVECAEDFDFTSRAILEGYNLYVMQDYLLKYRIRESSISNSNSLRQKAVSSIIRQEYRKAQNKGYEYNPYKKIDLLKITEDEKRKYSKAHSEFIKNYRGSYINKFIIIIKIFFISRDYFKYNLLNRIIGLKLARLIV